MHRACHIILAIKIFLNWTCNNLSTHHEIRFRQENWRIDGVSQVYLLIIFIFCVLFYHWQAIVGETETRICNLAFSQKEIWEPTLYMQVIISRNASAFPFLFGCDDFSVHESLWCTRVFPVLTTLYLGSCIHEIFSYDSWFFNLFFMKFAINWSSRFRRPVTGPQLEFPVYWWAEIRGASLVVLEVSK